MIHPLTRLKNLLLLNIADTCVSDIQPLVILPQLQNLSLSSLALDDPETIWSLKRLLYLNIDMPTSDISLFSRLSNLVGLVVMFEDTVDLTALSHMRNLKSLTLNSSDSIDLSPISCLLNLEKLVLNDTTLTDLEPVARLTNLKTLDLGDTTLTMYDKIRLAGLAYLDAESRARIFCSSPLT